MKAYIRLAACLVAAVVNFNFGAVSAQAEQSVFVQEEEVTLVAPEPVQEVETPVTEPVQETPVVEEPTQETPVIEETPVVEEPVQETPVVEETPVIEEPVQETPVVEPVQEETPTEPAQDAVSTSVVDTQPVADSSQQTTVETAQPVVSETVVTDTVQTVETVQISEVAEADATPSATVTQAVVETKTVEAPAVDVKGVRRELDSTEDNSSIVEEGEDTSDIVVENNNSSIVFAVLLAILLLMALLYRYKVIVVSDNDNEEDSKMIYAGFKKACEKAKEAEDSEGVVSVTIEAAGLLKLLRRFRNESVERVEVIYNHVLADELYESVYATDSEVDIMEGILGYYLDRDITNFWILPEELEKIAADQAAEMARIGAENLIEMALDQI